MRTTTCIPIDKYPQILTLLNTETMLILSHLILISSTLSRNSVTSPLLTSVELLTNKTSASVHEDWTKPARAICPAPGTVTASQS
jgi:hypothetical protein